MGKYGALLFLILSSILVVVPSLCEECCHQHASETLKEMITGENVRDCFGDLRDIHVSVTGECPFGDMNNVNVDSLSITLQTVTSGVVFPNGTLEIVVRDKFEIIGAVRDALPRSLSSTNETIIRLKSHEFSKPTLLLDMVKVNTGVSFVTESFFSVTIKRSVFDLHGNGQPMLNLKAGASLVVLNPGDSKMSVTLRCIACSKPPIIARICENSSISSTVLEKSGQKNNTVPVIKFLPCDEDTEMVPSLEILGITYIGNIPDEVDAAWIAVRGDHRNGPKIILPNDTHVGKVFKFTITENATVISKFEVLRKGSGGNVSTLYKTNLATAECLGSDGAVIKSYTFLPIDNRLGGTTGICTPLCCSVQGGSGETIRGRDILGCFNILSNRDDQAEKVVNVYGECPFGMYTMPSNSSKRTVKGTKNDFGVPVVITFEVYDYPFLNDNDDVLKFENIHFQKRKGDGVATIILSNNAGTGSQSSTPKKAQSPTVIMDDCAVDGNIVVLVDDVKFQAKNSVFSQRDQDKSVLVFKANKDSDVSMTNCEFIGEECKNPMIFGHTCGNIILKGSWLKRNGAKVAAPTMQFEYCDLKDGGSQKLTITKTRFVEKKTLHGTTSWIVAKGSYSGPTVLVKDSDYRGIKSRRSLRHVYALQAYIEKGRTDEMGFTVKISDDVRDKWNINTWNPSNTVGKEVCFMNEQPISRTAIFRRVYDENDVTVPKIYTGCQYA